MLRNVYLHGSLKEKCGHEHRADVSSVSDAAAWLEANWPELKESLRDQHFDVMIDDDKIENPEAFSVHLPSGVDIHIIPSGHVGISWLAIGAAVFLGAAVISSFIVRPPAPKSRETSSRLESFVFNGPINVGNEGSPIPLVYGQMRVGGVVIGSTIENSSSKPATTAASTPGFVSGTDWTVNKGGKGGGGGSRTPIEAPDNLRTFSTARGIEAISQGPIVGLIDGLKSCYIDGTPIQNSDNSYNYKGLSIEQRVGLPTQSVLKGFPDVRTVVSVNTQIRTSVTPIVRTLSSTNIDRLAVTVRVPSLSRINASNGDTHGTHVDYMIQTRTGSNAWSTQITDRIGGKSSSVYKRTSSFELPPSTQVYSVRVVRTTADSSSAFLMNDLFFESYTEIIDERLFYPDTALIGATIDASIFGGTIPDRAYEIKGRIISVPSNYNAVTRAYTGVWNGTFQQAWTDNPAWILYDLLTNRRYGLGKYILDTQIDKFELYTIAQHNDQLVNANLGSGLMIPRYTLNTAISKSAPAIDVLRSIAGSMRCAIFYHGGKIRVSQDIDSVPVATVAPSNVLDGKFIYSRAIGHRERRSVGVVSWINPEAGYEPERMEYADNGLISTLGYRTGDVVSAYGVTNRGLAYRHAKWILEDEAASSDFITYKVGEDHAFVKPGDIIAIEDPARTARKYYGIISSASPSASSNTINLGVEDGSEINIGDTASFNITSADAIVTGTVNSLGTITSGVRDIGVTGTFASSLATDVAIGSTVVFETSLLKNALYRVQSIPGGEVPHTITAARHDITKYARVETLENITPDNILGEQPAPLGQPSGLSVFEFLHNDVKGVVSAVTFSWQLPDDARIVLYEVRYGIVGGEKIFHGSTTNNSVDITGVIAGDYRFEVRAVDGNNRYGPWVNSGTSVAATAVVAQSTAPAAVTGLSILPASNRGSAQLKWDPVIDTRPIRYRVFYNPSMATTAPLLSDVATDFLIDVDELVYSVTRVGWYFVQTVAGESILSTSSVSVLLVLDAVKLSRDVRFSLSYANALINKDFIYHDRVDITSPPLQVVSIERNPSPATELGLKYPAGSNSQSIFGIEGYGFEMVDFDSLISRDNKTPVIISGMLNALPTISDDWAVYLTYVRASSHYSKQGLVHTADPELSVAERTILGKITPGTPFSFTHTPDTTVSKVDFSQQNIGLTILDKPSPFSVGPLMTAAIEKVGGIGYVGYGYGSGGFLIVRDQWKDRTRDRLSNSQSAADTMLAANYVPIFTKPNGTGEYRLAGGAYVHGTEYNFVQFNAPPVSVMSNAAFYRLDTYHQYLSYDFDMYGVGIAIAINVTSEKVRYINISIPEANIRITNE